MTFGSSLDGLGAWRDTRLPMPRYLPLAALLAWGASLGNTAGLAHAAADVLLALSLVTQFRLWDDLVDRDHDRQQQPDRILARAVDCVPFGVAAWMLGLGNALTLLWLHGERACLSFLLLNLMAALWYRWHRARALAHALVLHLKYPAFVLLIAAPVTRHASLTLAAGIVYAAVLAFELLDTARLCVGPGRWILALSLCALALAPLAWGGGWAELASVFVLGAVVLVIWRQPNQMHAYPAARYLPFIAASISFAFAGSGSHS